MAFQTLCAAEPTWLTKGYFSPYYSESHKKFQKVLRKFISEVLYPEALAREEDGKRVSQGVIDKMGYASFESRL